MADQTTTVPVSDDEDIEVVDSKTLDAYINQNIKRYVGKVPVATVVGMLGTWIQTPTLKSDGSATVHPMPMDKYSVPMAIFHNDDAVRVYTLPMPIPTPRPADWMDRAPRRFTFTKATPQTVVIEEMTLATIGREIVDEWVQLAEDMSSADAEFERVMDFIEGMEASQPVGANKQEWLNKDELLSRLESKDHRDVDEEDDEEETEEVAPNGTTSPEASP